MNKAARFAEIVIPLSLKGTYTYLIPGGMEQSVIPGKRVIVQLGKNKLYSGIVFETHNREPEGFEAKPVLSVLDDTPLVTDIHLQFWKWLAAYYMCTPGEVMHAALPGGLKLASETVFRVNPGFRGKTDRNTGEEQLLKYLEEENGANLDEIFESRFGREGIRIVKRMLESGEVSTDQQLRRAYTPKKIRCISLHSHWFEEKYLSELMDKLAAAPAQVKAIEEYASLSGRFDKEAVPKDVQRAELLKAGVQAHAINALIKKKVFISYEISVSRIHLEQPEEQLRVPYPLTDSQEKVRQEIKDIFVKIPVVLLHGITSSGKTEIYIHLILEQLRQGKQVLYLLPEIALTTQIIRRLKRVLGKKIGVYHSQYSDNERAEIFRNLAGMTEEEPFDVILGVRSAIFLPFRNLGLIIIDEEHENTYKQNDPAPRYHARDAATILAMYSGARVLMGSATPSFESLYNATLGKYGLVELKQRYGEGELPAIIVGDVVKAKKRKQMRSVFTPELLSGLSESFDRGLQAILFQNRRGYSNYFHCLDCGEVLKCTNCDVSLTFHKFSGEMLCHYCGIKMPVPYSCPDCRSHNFVLRGVGTEKVEDELGSLFPGIAVGRLDLDQMKSRKSYENLIGDFEKGKIQVLVGTQMVTKGLDFEKVNLVGIIDADSMLNFPDFRAFERSYQLMVQVSGRAGRRDRIGRVVIQTGDPSHPVIKKVLENDFRGFFNSQMDERKMFNYPPYSRLIRITLRHEIPSILDGGAVFLANEMREIFGKRVLGPQPPLIGKAHGKFIREINLKIEREAGMEKVKSLLGELMDIFAVNPVYRQIRRSIDVDPL